MRSPILGGSGKGRSPTASTDRCINLYLEKAPQDDPKVPTEGVLYSVPGLRRLATFGTEPILWAGPCNEYLCIVQASKISLVRSASWDVVTSVTIPTAQRINNSRVTAVFNDIPVGPTNTAWQVAICDGSQYLVTRITNPGKANVGLSIQPASLWSQPGPPLMVYAINGRAVVIEGGTNKIWTSDPYNFEQIDGLAFGLIAESTGNAMCSIAFNQQVWVFKRFNAEVWADVGTTPFPLARLSNVNIEVGCVSPHAAVNVGNTIFWIGQSTRGGPNAYIADGYSPREVSTPLVVQEWESYKARLSDVFVTTYTQGGHAFVLVTFPSVEKTWCYDFSSGEWHERLGWNMTTSEYLRYPGAVVAYWNGLNLAADYRYGVLYEIDPEYYAYGTEKLRWSRTWRALPKRVERDVSFASLRIMMESGWSVPQTDKPAMMLRWSDDGGYKWSSEMWESMGLSGDYASHCKFKRLGSTRNNHGVDRIFELSGHSPQRIAIVGAEVEVDI